MSEGGEGKRIYATNLANENRSKNRLRTSELPTDRAGLGPDANRGQKYENAYSQRRKEQREMMGMRRERSTAENVLANHQGCCQTFRFRHSPPHVMRKPHAQQVRN